MFCPSGTFVALSVMLQVVAPAAMVTLLFVTEPLEDVMVIVCCLLMAGVTVPVKVTAETFD